jgi:hypothetical protein
MQLLGFMTGGLARDGGQAPSNRQIKKLQRKVKSLQKKETGGGSKVGFKPRDKDNEYIPKKEVLDAVRKAGGDKSGKYVNYLLSGQKKSTPDQRFTKGVKRRSAEEEDTQVEEDAAGDEEAPDASALASFGRGASNRHAQNRNKKLRKIDAVHVISYKISKAVATPVQHPTDYGIQC